MTDSFSLYFTKEMKDVILVYNNTKSESLFGAAWTILEYVELEGFIGLLTLQGMFRERGEAWVNFDLQLRVNPFTTRFCRKIVLLLYCGLYDSATLRRSLDLIDGSAVSLPASANCGISGCSL